jgi:hypothetical protein
MRDPPREFATHVATRAPATRVAILAQRSSLTLGSTKPAESTPGICRSDPAEEALMGALLLKRE